MRYRVAFRERTRQDGEVAENPPSFLDAQLDDEIVLDAALVTRNDPDANHSTDALEEDDDFLSLGTEVWDYEIADGKDQDFKDALRRSGMVVEFELLEDRDELGAV